MISPPRLAIAVPTGALQPGCLDLLRRAELVDLTPQRIGRRLLVDEERFRVILVRPSDVAAYVDFGAADVGIVGKDQLWEAHGSQYELVDLGFGACQLVMAVPEESPWMGPETWPAILRVATKYPRASAAHFAKVGHPVDLVSLHGSVELAPRVGLSDAIVDLTATGTTLRVNHLRVVATIGTSTARLVANQASLKTRTDEVSALAARLRAVVGSGADGAGR